MQTLIIGLTLAGVSATTVVAFKHPQGYSKLFPYLVSSVTAVFACIVVWHIAVEIVWRDLKQYLVPDFVPNAAIAIEQISLPYMWIVFWFIVSLAFLWINLKLPPFLQVADQN